MDITRLINTAFIGNTADDGGGGVGTGTATISGSRFKNNQANGSYSNGGGLSGGNLTVTNTTFISNAAQVKGGGMYVDTLIATSTDFISNTGGDGGGAYVNSATINDSRFENNQVIKMHGWAYGNGGGLYVNTLAVTNTDFINNMAQTDGGGVYAYHTDFYKTLVMNNTNFISNTAQGKGGGAYVYFWSGGGSGVLNTVEFDRNRAGNGGGLYLSGTLSQSGGVVTLTHNSATTDGGGVYAMGGSFTLTNARILSNTAATGGAIYKLYAAASVTNSCIVSNSDTAVYYMGMTPPFTATNNWWGATSGPSGAGPGSGDSVSSNVNYSGFLSSAIPGCPSKGSGLTYTISGRATSGSTGLAGVIVRASNGFSATTNASGYYTLTNLVAGTYILTPTLSGYGFSPVTRTVNLSGNQTGQDFIGAQGGPPQQKVYLPIVLK